MEALSLNEKINLRISQYIQFENIVNSCIEKFHADGNIDASNKRDFFNKCIQTKTKIYEQIDKDLDQ